jgi:hypothetical protein
MFAAVPTTSGARKKKVRTGCVQQDATCQAGRVNEIKEPATQCGANSILA